MQQKLRDLLEKEGLKPSQFAEMLGVNPAGISHLLAGRNKPGYELLQKILRRFPRINPDWLLVDRGPMYRDDLPTASDFAGEPTARPVEEQAHHTPDLFNPSRVGDVQPAPESPAAHSTYDATNLHLQQNHRAGARPIRIVVCYDDGSFECYTPPHIAQ